MGLRDILRKKDGDGGDGDAAGSNSNAGRLNAPPAVTFIRSDTVSQEVIFPPSHPANEDDANYLSARDGGRGDRPRRSLDVFRSGRSRSASQSSRASEKDRDRDRDRDREREKDRDRDRDRDGGGGKRLSQRLHLSRAPASSDNVPDDLPEIVAPLSANGAEDPDGTESQWEKRATILASAHERSRSRPSTPVQHGMADLSLGGGGGGGGSRERSRSRSGTVSTKEIDDDIQTAIRLHEEGDLARSTRIFGRLADPDGHNNPLSQVLYGLALRHGWGCTPDPTAAVTYLSKAASNAALVETLALQAGLKKGGAAKGELVLAIFELANCFRHGWGIPKDPLAAKQYYETAANLGDTDAMNEVAWCYLEGFGCKKDKFAAARYYRLAEKNGNKTLGNSWIWKDKYNPPEAGTSKK